MLFFGSIGNAAGPQFWEINGGTLKNLQQSVNDVQIKRINQINWFSELFLAAGNFFLNTGQAFQRNGITGLLNNGIYITGNVGQRVFVIGNSGEIGTNTIQNSAPPGGIVKRLPIYDELKNFVGYIPIMN